MDAESKYTHKKGIVFKNQYHIIFCPKYRRKVLTPPIEKRLKEILYEQAEKMDVEILALEVMPNHVHMFVSFDPRIMPHKVVKGFKGASSHILREEFPELKSKLPTLWTRSYFMCTVGHVNEDTIRKYIEDQKNK
jgi:putative transposase